MTPEELFWKGNSWVRGRDPGTSPEHVDQLCEAARLWRAEGRFLSAGLAMVDAQTAGWGAVDAKTAYDCACVAIADLGQCVESCGPDSVEALLALQMMSQHMRTFLYFDGQDSRSVRRARQSAMVAYADRLVSHFAGHSEAEGFLARGFHLGGPVTGPWTPEFPEYEVSPDGRSSGGGVLCFHMSSAFTALVEVGDYNEAWAICDKHKTAFSSPGRQGWRLAIEGFVNPRHSHELFRRAAEALEKDTPERKTHAMQSWSSINRDLWAPYFRSRSWLATAVREPQRVEECISAAAKCAPPFGGWHNTVVYRFHLLVQALAGILDLDHGRSPDEVRADFKREIRHFGETDDDPVVLDFVDHAIAGFDRLRENRCQGLVSIGRAMAALDRLPKERDTEREALSIAIDHQALKVIEGPCRIWIYRTLAGIREEKTLHTILLRLFQNQIPRYAQVRHGPIEYGKDIVVAVQRDDRIVLRMYQVKCGNIKKRDWHSIRSQLEEMFQVPLQSLQIPSPIDRRVGILICNGHIEPHVEPVIAGWADDQLTAHNRNFDVMHLDDLVNYILDHRLIGALRVALQEAEVPVIAESTELLSSEVTI